MSAPHPLIHVVSDAMASAGTEVASAVRELAALDIRSVQSLGRAEQIDLLVKASAVMRRTGGSLLRAAVLFELVASAEIERTP